MTKKEVINIYSELRINRRRCIENELHSKHVKETQLLHDKVRKEKAPFQKEMDKIENKYSPEFKKLEAKYSRTNKCPDTMPPALAKFDAETNKKILDYANDITKTLTEP